MPVNLKGRSFLTLLDFSPAEIRYLLDLSHDLKSKKRAGILGKTLRGKNVVLLFEKTSTRTRCAFETAIHDEGGQVTYLDAGSSQMGKKESLEDTARVLGRFFDGIEYRGFKQSVVEDLARYSGVPVFNGLTDVDHPTQILADMLTMEEHIAKPLKDCKVVFVGDVRNNMCYAWMYGCAKMGMTFVGYGPNALIEQVDNQVLEKISAICSETGAQISLSDDISSIKNADVLYSDIWASMGEEDQIPARAQLLAPFRITNDMIKATGNPDVKFMHCLPSFHDFETTIDIREVTDEVFRGPHSIVFDEAENRLHTIKAVLVAMLGS